MTWTPVAFRTEEEFVEYAIKRWQAAPDEQAAAFRQKQLSIVMNHARAWCDKLLKTGFPEICELSVKEYDTITAQIFERAVVTGLQFYAALSCNGREVAVGAQVAADELWVEARKNLDDEATEHLHFSAALRALGPVVAVIDVLAKHIIGNLRTVPFVRANLQDMYNVTFQNLQFGLALEHACGVCGSMQKSHDDFIFKLMSEKAGTDINLDTHNLSARIEGTPLEDMLINDPNVNPWPLDEVCRCGHSLVPFIFCCDPSKPLSIAHDVEHFDADHQVHCACCGRNLHGFTCDLCGRVYSWHRGVVDSLPME